MKHKSKNRNIKIFEAINSNDLDKVKKLLPKVDKYLMLDNIYNLMCYALLARTTEIFDYLATEMDIDHEYPNGNTVLSQIIIHISMRKDGILRALHLTKNINYAGFGGSTILHRIVNTIHINNFSPMIEDYKERLSILLENGADPYIKNKQNVSPIDISLMYLNSMETLKILLNNKINKPIEIEIFNSALCKNYVDKFDMIELFIYHVADINELCENNHSVLWNAKNSIPDETDIIELLEESGAISI